MVIAPRPFGQVLGDGMSGLGRTWKALASAALLIFIPVGIVTLVIFQVTGANDFLDKVVADPRFFDGMPADEFLELAQPFFQAVALVVALQILASLFVYLACHRIVASEVAGEAITGSQARRFALRRMGVGLVAALLALVAVMAALGIGLAIWLVPLSILGTPTATSVLISLALLVIFVFPGIWLAISLSMTTPVVALEDKGPANSLARSFRLVRGRWWPTLGFLLMVGLLGSVANLMIQLVAVPMSAVGDPFSGLSLASAIGIVAQGLIVAGIAAMNTAWYIDLRSRKETLLSESLR